MANHIKRSRKQWVCNTCKQSIKIGEKCFCHFESSLPYGKYIVPMIRYRVNLGCVKLSDVCCKTVRWQIENLLSKLEKK